MCIRDRCNAMLFLKQKKQAAGPKSLGWVHLWVREREFELRQALLFFSLFFPACPPFLFFSPFCFFFNIGVFLLKYCTYILRSFCLELHLSPQLLPSLCRDRFKAYYDPSEGACAVCHACMCRVYVLYFLLQKTKHIRLLIVRLVQIYAGFGACVQLEICGPDKHTSALSSLCLLFAFYFRCLPSFCSCVPCRLCISSICRTDSFRKKN